MKRYLFSFIWLIISSNLLLAQQMPQFSQYLFNPIYINPAYAGYKGDTFIQTYNRFQWLGLKGRPVNYGLAADGAIERFNLGWGVHAGNETIGFQRNSTFQTKLAYHLRINRLSYVSFGTSIGFWNQKIDEDKVDPIQKDDPLLNTNFNSIFYPDLGFGIFYYHKYFHIGGAMYNILGEDFLRNPSFPYIELKQSLNLSGGFRKEFLEGRAIEGSFLLLADNKSPTRIDLNMNVFLNDRIGVGLGSRNQINYFGIYSKLNSFNLLQFIISTEIRISDSLEFGYSFDYDFKTSFQQFNSHELSIGYRIKNKNFSVLSPRYF